MHRFSFYLYFSFALLFLAHSKLNGQSINSSDQDFVVVLDAGHGGKDSGNLGYKGSGFKEKNIALNIVLQVGKILEKTPGIKVVYTRDKDVFIELYKRADIANKVDADLFISIHCDSFSNPEAYGAGTFVLGLHENERNFRIAQKENAVIYLEEDYEKNYPGFDPNSPESVISLLMMQETYLDQSIEAANTIQQSFIKNLNRKDRTVKQAGFAVLRNTYMPSVLVETGFLTNVTEGKFLNSSKGQSQMSNAIAKAILNYRNILDSSVQHETVFQDDTPLVTGNEITSPAVVFKVQLAAGKNDLPLKSYNFKGLNELSKQYDGSLYRYFFGNATSFSSAKKLLNKAKKAGYSNAFFVGFVEGKKVSLEAALEAIR